MWFRATTRMPYYEDPDYRASVVASIKSAFGEVPIDITFLPSWGIVEVQTDLREEELPVLPMLNAWRSAIDREMVLGPRTVV